jgi:hypothetical protein
MRRVFLKLSACWLVVCVAGCASVGGPSTSNGPRAADFSAVTVGTRWSYALVPGPTAPQAVSVVSRDERGFFVDDRGGRLAPRSDGIFDGERFLLKEPVVAGSTWTAVVAGVTEQYRIVATDLEVTVPAGTFSGCVEVEGMTPTCDPQSGRAATLRMRWVWAPKVGMVRLQQFVSTHDAPCGATTEATNDAPMGAVDGLANAAPRSVDETARPTATMELVSFSAGPPAP